MDDLLRVAVDAAEAAAEVHRKWFGRVGVEGAEEKAPSDFVTRVDLEAQAAALAVIRDRFPEHAVLAEEADGDDGREHARSDEEDGRPLDGNAGTGEGVGRPGSGPGWAGNGIGLPDSSATRPGEGSGLPDSGSGRPADGHAMPRGVSARIWPDDGTCLWIVDPLDGTTNFLHRHPLFAASVAVGRRVPPVAGERPVTTAGISDGSPATTTGCQPYGEGVSLEAAAVVCPPTGERWWARRGRGAWKNGKRISVSPTPSLRRALVGTGFPFKEPDVRERYLAQLGRVLAASGGVRRGGSAALDLCYLAEGIFDAFWEEAYLSPWDMAGGALILAEAGGVITRMDGTPLDLSNGSILAANSLALWTELGRILEAY